MHIKKGFELRDICGEKVIIATGIENVDFSKMISLNESVAYLWKNIDDKDFTAESLAELLCQEYEIDLVTATNDASQIMEEWKQCGIIE